MMKRIVTLTLFSLLIFVNQMVSFCRADDAQVLPRGVFNLGLETRFYFPMDKRYNQDGVREDVAIDFNTNLNSSVFPALGLVEQYFGMPAGSASIGRSVVSFEITVNQLVFNFAYGLTDRLTVGLNLPYYWQRKE